MKMHLSDISRVVWEVMRVGKTEVLVTVFLITCKKRKLKLLIQEYFPRKGMLRTPPCFAIHWMHLISLKEGSVR